MKGGAEHGPGRNGGAGTCSNGRTHGVRRRTLHVTASRGARRAPARVGRSRGHTVHARRCDVIFWLASQTTGRNACGSEGGGKLRAVNSLWRGTCPRIRAAGAVGTFSSNHRRYNSPLDNQSSHGTDNSHSDRSFASTRQEPRWQHTALPWSPLRVLDAQIERHLPAKHGGRLHRDAACGEDSRTFRMLGPGPRFVATQACVAQVQYMRYCTTQLL